MAGPLNEPHRVFAESCPLVSRFGISILSHAMVESSIMSQESECLVSQCLVFGQNLVACICVLDFSAIRAFVGIVPSPQSTSPITHSRTTPVTTWCTQLRLESAVTTRTRRPSNRQTRIRSSCSDVVEATSATTVIEAARKTTSPTTKHNVKIQNGARQTRDTGTRKRKRRRGVAKRGTKYKTPS
jgi:hypothetical protein